MCCLFAWLQLATHSLRLTAQVYCLVSFMLWLSTDLACSCTLPAARADCHKHYRYGILHSIAHNDLALLQVLHIIDATLTGIFGLEAIAKIVAFSFAIYFKSNSNKVQASCLTRC